MNNCRTQRGRVAIRNLVIKGKDAGQPRRLSRRLEYVTTHVYTCTEGTVKTKLTVTIDEELLPKAKDYARSRGVSPSQLMLITKNGTGRALLIPVDEKTDLEALILSNSPKFWELFDRAARSKKWTPLDEI